VGNIIGRVDEFFASLIGDDVGRFFCLHLPFWGTIIFFAWNITEAVGLFLLFAAIVFLLTPYVVAQIGLSIYAEDQIHYSGGSKWGLFRFSLCGYIIAVLALIGVPGWYFGFIMEGIRTKTFTEFYWDVIYFWYQVFNFYHRVKPKDLKLFLQDFSFAYQTWQIAFLISSVVITPILFYYFYQKTRQQAEIEAFEQTRSESEARARLELEKAQIEKQEERNRVFEERRRKELEAEQEKQKKIQEKLQEIKGKDPWDSGFL